MYKKHKYNFFPEMSSEDFTNLKDAEIEAKVNDLSKKYWQSQNAAVKHQISVFLDIILQVLLLSKCNLIMVLPLWIVAFGMKMEVPQPERAEA
mgnify:CR=1 FL=1